MASEDLVRRRARQLAAGAAGSGDPAGWFETLYAGRLLAARSVERFLDEEDPPKLRWRAEFSRG